MAIEKSLMKGCGLNEENEENVVVKKKIMCRIA